MKRIEAIVPVSKEKDIVDALRKSGIGGLTVTPGKGRGRGPRQVKPGPGRYIERYNDMLTFLIMTEDSRADKIVSLITDVAHTGSPGDGKIFISSVEAAVDIATKQRDEKLTL